MSTRPSRIFGWPEGSPQHARALAVFRRTAALHPGREAALWFRLMGINPRERMNYYETSQDVRDAPLLRAVRQ
jgi:hypothetical protein